MLSTTNTMYFSKKVFIHWSYAPSWDTKFSVLFRSILIAHFYRNVRFGENTGVSCQIFLQEEFIALSRSAANFSSQV